MLTSTLLVVLGLGTAVACPTSRGPDRLAHPSVHDSPEVPGRPRWTWRVDPADSRGLSGAHYRLEDGREVRRFHLPWALRELVVDSDGVALGFARTHVDGIGSLVMMAVDPGGGVTLLDERLGARDLRTRWHPGAGAQGHLAVELEDLATRERTWLALDHRRSPATWSLPPVEDEATGWFAQTVEPPRRRAPAPEVRPVELAWIGSHPIDIHLEPWRAGLGSMPDAEVLPSGRLAVREFFAWPLVVCDPRGRVLFQVDLPATAGGNLPRLARLYEPTDGSLWLDPSSDYEDGWPIARPDGRLEWGLPPALVSDPELDDGRTWGRRLQREGPVVVVDPAGREATSGVTELEGLSKHADGTWIERRLQAFAPDGSSILYDGRHESWPGSVVSFFDAEERLVSTRRVPSGLDECAWSGTWLAAEARVEGPEGEWRTVVHLIPREGPIRCFELPERGDLAGFTPDGGELVVVTGEPFAIHRLAVP